MPPPADAKTAWAKILSPSERRGLVYSVCGGLIAGLLLSPFWHPHSDLLGFLAGTGALLLIWRKEVWGGVLAGLFLLSLLLGFWRGNVAVPQQLEQSAEVEVAGEVVRPPDHREKVTILTLRPLREYCEPRAECLSFPRGGLLRVTLPPSPTIHWGDRVVLAGLWGPPPVLTTFDFPTYLATRGVVGVMSFPRLEQHLSSPHSWRATLDYLRALVRKAINRGLTEPEASVLRAFMLGERGSLSPRIRALAQRTGVAHIFAISGLHIGLWILLLLGAASALGLPRIVASGAIILLTTWYVLLVGAPPSAVRAAIMAGIVLLAYLAGRPAKSLRLLLLAAAAMLWFNPALRSSIGFQLSFAAVAGIVLTVPVLRLFLPLAWQRSSAILFLLVSLSAQLATLPLVLAFFQLFPSASLPANFVMVPLLPVLIGGGWLAALAGTLFPAGAPIFFFPLQLLLRAQLLTLEVLEKPLPAFSFALDWRWLPAIYLLLLLLLASGALYARKRRLPLTLF